LEKKFRSYGKLPARVVLVHGGPGAIGSLGSLANCLVERDIDILEPYQTKFSIFELVFELAEQIDRYAQSPIILIGHSWGAWLSFLYAAKRSHKICRLVLLGAGPFIENYVHQIQATRMARLSVNDKERFQKKLHQLSKTVGEEQRLIMQDIQELVDQTDNFELIAPKDPILKFDHQQYNHIWLEAVSLRKNGTLLANAKTVNCPVIGIHGDYDPHPAEGVSEPLGQVLRNFNMLILPDCGHSPWLEKNAKIAFLDILEAIIKEAILNSGADRADVN